MDGTPLPRRGSSRRLIVFRQTSPRIATLWTTVFPTITRGARTTSGVPSTTAKTSAPYEHLPGPSSTAWSSWLAPRRRGRRVGASVDNKIDKGLGWNVTGIVILLDWKTRKTSYKVKFFPPISHSLRCVHGKRRRKTPDTFKKPPESTESSVFDWVQHEGKTPRSAPRGRPRAPPSERRATWCSRGS